MCFAILDTDIQPVVRHVSKSLIRVDCLIPKLSGIEVKGIYGKRFRWQLILEIYRRIIIGNDEWTDFE